MKSGPGKAELADAVGVILAGGTSRRFGRDKSLELLHGVPLIQRVHDILAGLFPRLLIVANEPEKYDFLRTEVHADLIPGLGPLGGIYTGLSVVESPWLFFVACDMPCIRESLVRAMYDLRNDFDLVVPRVGDKLEPLHAFYHRRCLEPVRRFIDSGRRQIFLFFPQVRVRYMEEHELRAWDPELRSFFNINYPQELAGPGAAQP